MEYQGCRDVSVVIYQQRDNISGGNHLILTFTLLTSFSSVILQFDHYEGLENAIAVGVGIFSLLLLALSITAYRKTGLRITIFAIIIFALFAIQQLLDYLDNIYSALDTPLTDVTISALTLAILVLFFLAIVRWKS